MLFQCSTSRYNAVGQLTCVVCTAPVKNELLWSTHLQSRKHKDNVAALKSKAASVGVKRKPQEQVGVIDYRSTLLENLAMDF